MKGTLTQFNSNGRGKIPKGDHHVQFQQWPTPGQLFGFTFIGEDLRWHSSVRVSQRVWVVEDKEMRFSNYHQVFGLVVDEEE